MGYPGLSGTFAFHFLRSDSKFCFTSGLSLTNRVRRRTYSTRGDELSNESVFNSKFQSVVNPVGKRLQRIKPHTVGSVEHFIWLREGPVKMARLSLVCEL